MKINTEERLKLVNGKEIKLTLTYGSLNRLSTEEPELVEEYFEIQEKSKILNDLEIAKTLYIAYRCADNEKPTLTYIEFLDLIPANRIIISKLYAKLMYPKN